MILVFDSRTAIKLVPFAGAPNDKICVFWFSEPCELLVWALAQHISLDLLSSEDLKSLYPIPVKKNLKGEYII